MLFLLHLITKKDCNEAPQPAVYGPQRSTRKHEPPQQQTASHCCSTFNTLTLNPSPYTLNPEPFRLNSIPYDALPRPKDIHGGQHLDRDLQRVCQGVPVGGSGIRGQGLVLRVKFKGSGNLASRLPVVRSYRGT